MWTAIGLGGAALASGLIGANAAGESADAMVGASNRATDLNGATYRTTRADLSPYRLAGNDALKRLMYLTGVGGAGPTLAYKGATDLVDMAGGVPAMNQRYADDKDYVQAWNDLESAHRAKEGGRSYTSTSDASQIATALGTKLRSEEDAKRMMGSAAAGASSDGAYGSLLKDFSLADFEQDPGYAFRQSEGEKALERAAASRGLSASTPGLKSLMRFNQDLASQEYGAAYSRDAANKSTKFNLLSYLSGGGQNAAAMTGTAGTNAAAGSSQALMMGGAAMGQGAMGAAGAWNNAIQGGLGNYMYQQRFDQMMKRMPVFNATGGGAGATGSVSPGVAYGE